MPLLSQGPVSSRRLARLKALSSPDGSFSLESLFGGRHGTTLPTHIIAHSTEVQTLYDNLGVALGIQWELTRGACTGKWTWEDIAVKMKAIKTKALDGDDTELKQFRINSKVAWQIPDLMRGRIVGEPRDLALWNEGLLDEYWEGQTNYYGGRIEYPLRLKKSDDPDRPYEIVLEKPQKGRSFRFARDLGSSSILHLSIPPQLVRAEGDGIRRFLAQRFILNGRVYIPIPPKDTTSVYLIQTDQNYERQSMGWYGDKRRLSFDHFIQRHNPPELNSQQPFAKYTARFALGWNGEGKPPAEKIMTDGCGFMNRSALLLIRKRVGYDRLPTAVQGRIGGAKGLWTLHPDDLDEKPKIWIRDSQLKIKLSDDHRVHRIFDLLRASRPSPTESRERLSEQSILCLSHNGIPDDVLSSLLVEGLEATVKPLLDWAPGTAVSLWRAIDRAGNVDGTRVQRIAGGQESCSCRSARDKVGGPMSLHERAMELIQAGFHPEACEYLYKKLKLVVNNEINTVIEKYRISLPESTASEAFVIPDPSGRLKPNQIYYRSSNPMKDPTTQTLFQILEGDVIVSFSFFPSEYPLSGRYPMRLPCDLQMVTAVDIPELYNWPDVIIASTAGQHSLLSLLSGGDYDGDTVVFIWLKEFCEKFGANKPLTTAPKDLMDNFHQEVKTVVQVGHELRGLSPEDSQLAFQEYLLKGLRDSQVGLYSYFHENAIWRHGYGHVESIKMAYIGNILLDAGKTDPKQIIGQGRVILRGSPFSKFYTKPGKAKRDKLLAEYEAKLPKSFTGFKKDDDLLKPYKYLQAKAQEHTVWSVVFKSDLEEIERHVRDGAFEVYKRIYSLPKEERAKRAAIVLSAQEKFTEPVPNIQLVFPEELEQVKASYAYSLTAGDSFGFSVAFGTLCSIKAKAGTGGDGSEFAVIRRVEVDLSLCLAGDIGRRRL
ncbi:RNA-dependent RNA polymerase [Mycena sanguinolenta]|uniref:RNA-dependent RNA polymerase n=1 Tax=Mycena sanguinolenta TaxID=230812 RepID=A0A8H7CMR3_9AGAR|nr:RNA-dependent RNA polymerase [Mycena sanguinolenta]